MPGGRPRTEERDPTPLGARIIEAYKAAGFTQTSLETKAKFGRGYLSKLIYRSKNVTVDPLKLETVADILSVDFHWLATGRGEARSATTPRAAAAATARRLNCREDAIEHVDQTVPDASQDERYWLEAYLHESDARRRAGVPESQEVERRQRLVRRRAKQSKKEWAAAEERERASKPPPSTPASVRPTGTHAKTK